MVRLKGWRKLSLSVISPKVKHATIRFVAWRFNNLRYRVSTMKIYKRFAYIVLNINTSLILHKLKFQVYTSEVFTPIPIEVSSFYKIYLRKTKGTAPQTWQCNYSVLSIRAWHNVVLSLQLSVIVLSMSLIMLAAIPTCHQANHRKYSPMDTKLPVRFDTFVDREGEWHKLYPWPPVLSERAIHGGALFGCRRSSRRPTHRCDLFSADHTRPPVLNVLHSQTVWTFPSSYWILWCNIAKDIGFIYLHLLPRIKRIDLNNSVTLNQWFQALYFVRLLVSMA